MLRCEQSVTDHKAVVFSTLLVFVAVNLLAVIVAFVPDDALQLVDVRVAYVADRPDQGAEGSAGAVLVNGVAYVLAYFFFVVVRVVFRVVLAPVVHAEVRHLVRILLLESHDVVGFLGGLDVLDAVLDHVGQEGLDEAADVENDGQSALDGLLGEALVIRAEQVFVHRG